MHIFYVTLRIFRSIYRDSCSLRLNFFGVPPCSSDSKISARNAGDLGSIPGSGRSPGKGNDNPLQYSCLENSMDRRAWEATVYGIKEQDMTE